MQNTVTWLNLSTSCPSSASSYSERNHLVFRSLQRTHRCGSNNTVASKQKVAGREKGPCVWQGSVVKRKTMHSRDEMLVVPSKGLQKRCCCGMVHSLLKAIWKSKRLFNLFIFDQREPWVIYNLCANIARQNGNKGM